MADASAQHFNLALAVAGLVAVATVWAHHPVPAASALWASSLAAKPSVVVQVPKGPRLSHRQHTRLSSSSTSQHSAQIIADPTAARQENTWAPLATVAALSAALSVALMKMLQPQSASQPPMAMCSYGGTLRSNSERISMELGATGADAPTQSFSLIDKEGLKKVLDETDVFVFDCDGVIWKGDTLIERVPETLEFLKSQGKQLFFVTNNSTKSRAGYLDKFTSLGLNVKADEIYSSSYAAAAYMESINYPKDKPIYIIGEVGIEQELAMLGFKFIGGPKDAGKTIELKAGFALDHDEEVGAVIVGFDRHFNYYKIQYAQLCINENPGCLFIATNTDAVTHLTDAQEWAGNGSMVGAIKGCTGKQPTVVGKPSGFMMDNIAQKFHIPKHRICMVGDRLDTDILFGQDNGTNDMLVLSGVTTEETLRNPKTRVRPSAVANSIADFLTLK